MMPNWEAGKSGPKVLVVDDVPGNRAIMCRRLGRLDYQCVEAESGFAALQALCGSLPDVILLDYMMPEMSGIDLLRTLKADSRTSGIPVIMVTARTEGDVIAEALDAGAEDYVTKPIDFTNLDARIKNVLQRSNQSSDLRKINQTLDSRIVMRSLELAQVHEELKSERSITSELMRKLSTSIDTQVSCDASCRDVNLRSIDRVSDLLDVAIEQFSRQLPVNPAILLEIKANIGIVRQNLLQKLPD